MKRFRAVAAGTAALILTTTVWVYLTYDLLQSWSSKWFYRVNALWHEYPEPRILLDPAFLLSLMVEGTFTFGLAAFVTAWLSPRQPWGPVAIVVALGTLPALARGVMASVAEAPVGFKSAFGAYLLSAWLLGLGFAWAAVKLRSSCSGKLGSGTQ